MLSRPTFPDRVSPEAKRLLGAIALVEVLGLSTLARLALGRGEAGWHVAWTNEALADGYLVSVGAPSLLSLAPPLREPTFAVSPPFAQLAIRELRASGELASVAAETRKLLEGRSVSEIVEAVQSGDLSALSRRAVAPRLPRMLPNRTAAEWLQMSM